MYFAVHPLECEIDLADGYGKLLDRGFLRGDASEGDVISGLVVVVICGERVGGKKTGIETKLLNN